MEKQVKGVINGETIIIKMEQDDVMESPREWDNLGKMVCFHSRYTLGDRHDYDEPKDLLMDLVSDTTDVEHVKQALEKTVEKGFDFKVKKQDEDEYVITSGRTDNPYEYEAFETEEEALDYLEEEKERWSEGDALEDFTMSELYDLVKEGHVILPLYLYDHSGITMNTTGFSCSWDSGQVGYIYASKERIRTEMGYTENEKFSKDTTRIPVAGEHVRIKGFRKEELPADDILQYGRILSIHGDFATVDFDSRKSPSFRDPKNIVTVPLANVESVLSNQAEEALKGEVELYDQYLTGDVYFYTIEKEVYCSSCQHVETETVDSCGGFYGDDPFENGMADNIADEYLPLLKKLA